MVCHFYREATERCKIMDMHMAKLAPKHLDTRFLKACQEISSCFAACQCIGLKPARWHSVRPGSSICRSTPKRVPS